MAFVENDSRGFLSDILSAICGQRYAFYPGHKRDYWMEPGNKEIEIFANLFALESFQDEKVLSFLKKHFPQVLVVYQRFLI